MPELQLSDYLTAASVVVAIVVYVFGYRERLIFERRQNTINLLSEIFRDGPVQEGHAQIVRWIVEKKQIESDRLPEQEEKLLIPLLEFYDFISDAALNGVIDKELVILHRGGGMRSAHALVKNYIRDRKTTLGRPNVFAPFEQFVDEVARRQEARRAKS